MLPLLIFDPSIVVGFIFVMAVAVRWFMVPSDDRRSEYLLLFSIFTLIMAPVAQAIADSLSALRPMKMDLYAYVADGSLGQPAFALGQVAAPHEWLKILLQVAYGLLPTAVIVLFTCHILQRSSQVATIVWAFVINLLAAPLFYLLVPVCGPVFAFARFPVNPGHVIPHMLRIDAAPNGIPSVHMSSALLIVWFSRKSRAGLGAAIAYGLLMVVATLASGQHYGVDLVAAVPYTAGVLWAAKVVALRSRQWSGAAVQRA